MKYSTKELCLIWLDSFIDLEYKHKQMLYKMVVDEPKITAVLEKGKDYIISEIGQKDYEIILNSANSVYFNFVLEGLERRDIIAITIESEKYPQSLLNTEIPPLVIYAKGNIDLLNDKIFGIVGSRKSLPASKKYAENYSTELIKAGFTLVTGIAEGIDEAVIKSALNCNGKVISVIAGGFDHLYPSSNQGLIDEVVKKGLVITEHAPEIKPMPYFFPVRNRIIAGLSEGVLIVSAGAKSGAIYTAEYAEEYSKDVFAIPYSIGVASGEGCNDLIKRGAILTDKVEDILAHYGITNEKQEVELSSDERQIVDCLKEGSLHIDKISKIIGKPVYLIMPTLSAMEIKGIVIKSGVNIFGLTRSDV